MKYKKVLSILKENNIEHIILKRRNSADEKRIYIYIPNKKLQKHTTTYNIWKKMFNIIPSKSYDGASVFLVSDHMCWVFSDYIQYIDVAFTKRNTYYHEEISQ